MLRNAMGVEDGKLPYKKWYHGLLFNIISTMRGWVGVKPTEKKVYLNDPFSFWRHFLQPPVLECLSNS